MDTDYTNPMILPTFALTAGMLALGNIWRWRSRSRSSAAAAISLGGLLAIPALLYAVYYLHVLDGAVWFYRLRAARMSELLAAGIGLPVGYALAALTRSNGVARLARRGVVAAMVVVVYIPYSKPLLLPLSFSSMQDRWRDGVCLQSTSATCGPACAATFLRRAGTRVTEREIAEECFSCATGTENWYLARALRRRGLRVSFAVERPEPGELPYPAIAGVRLGRGGPGHFVTVLGREGDAYLVGDPLRGQVRVTPLGRSGPYYFTGFFMMVEGRHLSPTGADERKAAGRDEG